MIYYYNFIIWMEMEKSKVLIQFLLFFSGDLGMPFSFFMPVGFAGILRQCQSCIWSRISWVRLICKFYFWSPLRSQNLLQSSGPPPSGRVFKETFALKLYYWTRRNPFGKHLFKILLTTQNFFVPSPRSFKYLDLHKKSFKIFFLNT